MTATREQIIQHTLKLSLPEIISYNWGLEPANLPKTWTVDEGTYINGVPVIVDHDLDYGYLGRVFYLGLNSGEVQVDTGEV